MGSYTATPKRNYNGDYRYPTAPGFVLFDAGMKGLEALFDGYVHNIGALIVRIVGFCGYTTIVIRKPPKIV